MKAETRVGIFIIVAIAIFFYLSFNIGSIRLDGSSYFYYKVYFEDTGGLEKKSVVKIAGVSVGWVESIVLQESGRAEIVIRVNRDHQLYRNSYATIAQDGLIGRRTLEIDPGDSSSGILAPGSSLALPGKSSATVTDIMESIKEITDSVQDVVFSLKGVFSTPENEKLMSQTVEKVSLAAKKLSKFAISLEDMASGNTENVNNMFSNLTHASDSLAHRVPEIGDKAANVADKAVEAADNFKDGSEHLSETFKSTDVIASRIKRGEGTLGKLITDEGLYHDVRDTVGGLKSYVGKAQAFSLNVDMHYERYYRTDNTRGIGEVRLAAYDDYFYALQVSSDERGKIYRKNETFHYYDLNDNEINTTDPTLSLYERARVPHRREIVCQDLNGFLFGAQFGKRFGDLELRVGLFENTFGFSLDYALPIKSKNFSLSTGLEVYDFNGYNRLKDDRVHVRWSNKLFMLQHVYSYFGFDDMFSKTSASPFWGGGLTFDDDDLKYLISMLPVGKM